MAEHIANNMFTFFSAECQVINMLISEQTLLWGEWNHLAIYLTLILHLAFKRDSLAFRNAKKKNMMNWYEHIYNI